MCARYWRWNEESNSSLHTSRWLEVPINSMPLIRFAMIQFTMIVRPTGKACLRQSRAIALPYIILYYRVQLRIFSCGELTSTYTAVLRASTWIIVSTHVSVCCHDIYMILYIKRRISIFFRKINSSLHRSLWHDVLITYILLMRFVLMQYTLLARQIVRHTLFNRVPLHYRYRVQLRADSCIDVTSTCTAVLLASTWIIVLTSIYVCCHDIFYHIL